MNRFTRYNRILAGALAAALVVTNLSANAQVVLASETEQNMNVTESVVETQDLTEAPAAASEETPAAEVAETPVSESSVETPTTEPPAESTEIPTVEESGSVTETDTTGNTGSDETNTDSTNNKEENTSETTETEEKSEEPTETETKFEVTKSLDCSQDHEHTADCYVYVDADGKRWTLTCTEDHEHTKDCYKEAAEKADKVEIIEESGDTHVVTYETEAEGITVRAEALSEVLPEGATLHASRIEDDDALTTVTEALDESDVTYDDYLALDVHFDDKDGNEIEPVGSVKVTFELAEELLPENVKADSLAVQHLEGTGENAEPKEARDINVVTVADTSDNEDTGSIQVVAADSEQSSSSDTTRNVSAEFEVKSFSTFTLTWKAKHNEEVRPFPVTALDENGDPLALTAIPDGTLQVSSKDTVNFDSSNTMLQIEGYTLVSCTAEVLDSDHTTAGTYENVTAMYIERDNLKWQNGYLKYKDENGKSQTVNLGNPSTASERDTGTVEQSLVKLTLYYKRAEATLSYVLKSEICDQSQKQSGWISKNDTYMEVSSSDDPPASQKVYYGSTVTLPECNAIGKDKNGTEYYFMGWFETNKFKVQTQDGATTHQIYQPGDSYVVKSDTTLYAIWSKAVTAKATFYIRLDGHIPSRTDTDTPSSKYTAAITVTEGVTARRWIYDTSAGRLVVDKDAEGKEIRSYITNLVTDSVTGNESALPTNREIQEKATSKFGQGFDYNVAIDEKTGELYVSQIYVSGSGTSGTTYTYDPNATQQVDVRSNNGFKLGDRLYVQWYTLKYRGDAGADQTYNVDGVLLAKDRVTVHYNANCGDEVKNIPSGYQVDPNTEITTGISGQATGGNVLQPERSGYTFLGWNTAADGSGTAIKNGAAYNVGNEDVTLYAVWQKTGGVGNLKVSVTTLKADGTEDNDDKTYTVKVKVPEAQLDTQSQYNVTIVARDGTKTTVTREFGSGTTTTDGTESFTIESGGYVFIENLPDNASYEVWESSVNGYRVTYKEANGETLQKGTGTIVNGMIREIQIINRPRIVKTGVTTNGIPQVALTSLLAAGIAMIFLYRRFRRDLTRNQ